MTERVGGAMTKPDHQMDLLSRATKDGEVLYPGLRKPLQECVGPDHRYDHPGPCVTAPSNTYFIPNPDPMALIAAAQGQGWVPIFYKEGYVELERIKVGGAVGVGTGPDNLSALIDSLFQAIDAENWGKCHVGGTGSGMTKPDGNYVDVCPKCKSTGKILGGPR